MTEDTNQISADNLRADFLNANTNWQRWKVLSRALDWAVAASENADAYRRQRDELRQQKHDGKEVTVHLDATGVASMVAKAIKEARGGDDLWQRRRGR